MSRTHPQRDICDFHAKANLYGLGAGVYPKAKAPKPPFHPFCRCNMLSMHSIDSTDAKHNPKAQKEFMSALPKAVQQRIAGSEVKLQRFNSGEDLLSIFDESKHRDYGVRYVGGIIQQTMKPSTGSIKNDHCRKRTYFRMELR